MRIRGRPVPRSQAEMEAELARLRARGCKRVIMGKPDNAHEAAPWIAFLKENGIEVIDER